MKINKHFKLMYKKSGFLNFKIYRTYRNIRASVPATKEQYDEITIIHYNDNKFTPILLHKDYISSITRWRIKDFYKDIKQLINIKEPFISERSSRYDMNTNTTHNILRYYWGCRKFNKRQLYLIKKTLEETYTIKQLTGK